MTDAEILARAPAGVEVVQVSPPGIRLDGFDRVVVSRPERLSDDDVRRLCAVDPVFFPHGDVLPRTPTLRTLVRASAPFIAMSPLLLERTEKWAGRLTDGIAMVPPMNTAGIPRAAEKKRLALWPHRDIWHKGWDDARRWAAQKGVPIEKMSGRPRAVVLEAMRHAKWVVLLSKILDACPRSIREAQMAGCLLIVNDNVGVWWDLTGDELRVRSEESFGEFWRIVCG